MCIYSYMMYMGMRAWQLSQLHSNPRSIVTQRLQIAHVKMSFRDFQSHSCDRAPFAKWCVLIDCEIGKFGSEDWIYGGCPKLWYPKTALTPRFREPFAPFRAPAESGHEIMIRFSFTSRFINNGIQTFREPYAALSRPFATAAKHTHPYLQMSLGY